MHVEEPLAAVCGTGSGTEQHQSDVWDARYPSTTGQDTAEETVRTYDSASYAASRLAAHFPTCPGLTAQTANGFAWRGPDPTGLSGTAHVLFARVGAKVAVVTISVGNHDYDPKLDSQVLAAMTQRLGK